MPTEKEGGISARGFAVIALLVGLLPGVCMPSVARAQVTTEGVRTVTVNWQNPSDGMLLTGTLTLPAGDGPHPGVVFLSLAGVREGLDHLAELGWAVLWPERRGLATIEHLLRASFQDLADDVRAAEAYLRSHPEIDASVVGLVAQGGETMAGVLAAVEPPLPAFVVLMSTTGLPGDETFWIEQHRIAEEQGYDAEAVAELDDYARRLTDIVVTDSSPGLRAFRVRALLGESEISLPRNAAFPPDPEDQVRFFASTWWRDLFLFQPEHVLERIDSPVLVLMGSEDPILPYEQHLPAIERALSRAPAEDVTVCVLADWIQHTLSPATLSVLEGWMAERLTPAGFASRPGDPPASCISPPAR